MAVTVSKKSATARTAATGKNQAQSRAKNAKSKEAAVQDAFNMQELLDELAAYKAELAAVKAKEDAQCRKALNEIQAAVQVLQEDEQNDTVRVERPKGSAGDGFKLRHAMGLGNKATRYQRIQRTVRRCVDKAGLNDTAEFRAQDATKLANVYKAAREKQPFLRRFVNDWATAEFVKTLLKNRRAAAARRARIERAADDADMDVDDDF